MSEVTLLTGDCMEQMVSLPDASVNCCVTSPPYWGLRDYGTATWEGGDAECDHIQQRASCDSSTLGPNRDGLGPDNAAHKAKTMQYKALCAKCGAVRIDQQLGLEATPDEYIARMVAIFAEVRRVLRDDGTLWLNLGDSYASSTKDSGGSSDKQLSNAGSRYENCRNLKHGLKPKDLVGIPWRVALALRADGWWLRQDIIWHKPNPMPESVTDRCTKAHEYVFLLSKSARYYYDAEAIKEPGVVPAGTRRTIGKADGSTAKARLKGAEPSGNEAVGFCVVDGTRNRRSVWTVATQPYKGAHFAVFPPALITPCVLAGCPAGGTVLDPFSGSGTTGFVAAENGRKYIGIELNPEYQELARQRIAAAQPPLFAPGRKGLPCD